MPINASQWPRHLKSAQLAPVYLLTGEELLVLEAADALRARARALSYTERDVLSVEAGFDWDDLARAAAGMSLFATRRVIDLRLPTGRPGREGSKAISAYCADPPPDTVLLITCVNWSRAHEGAWSKAVDKTGAMVVFWAPRPHELAGWIQSRLATHGLEADAQAVAVLADRVEGNLLAAAQEVDKLVMLHAGRRITGSTMQSLVADSARFDAFKLTDAAFSGDAARALRILDGLKAEGTSPIPLAGWLVSQLQLAQRLASARDFAAQAKAEGLWSTREQLFRKALRRAPRGHWLDCLALAAEIDRRSKGRASGDEWIAMQRLVTRIAAPDHRGSLA